MLKCFLRIADKLFQVVEVDIGLETLLEFGVILYGLRGFGA